MNPSDPICTLCALANGWKWPDNHLGTYSKQECVQCREITSCCEVSDCRKK